MARRGYAVSRKTNDTIKEAINDLAKAIKAFESVPTQILAEEAPRIREEAQLKTPFRSGKLQSNIKVQVSRSKYTPGIYANVSAIHRGYDYAGIQHDDETLNHPKGGQANFLAEPFQEGVERIIARLEDELDFD